MMKNVTQMVLAALKVTNIRSEWNPDSYGKPDSLYGNPDSPYGKPDCLYWNPEKSLESPDRSVYMESLTVSMGTLAVYMGSLTVSMGTLAVYMGSLTVSMGNQVQPCMEATPSEPLVTCYHSVCFHNYSQMWRPHCQV
jgi:hypothetical protein